MLNMNPKARIRTILTALIAALAAGCALESSVPTDDVTSSGVLNDEATSSGGETIARTDQAMSIGFCQANCNQNDDDVIYQSCLTGCMDEGGGGEGGGGHGHSSCHPKCSACHSDASMGSGKWRTCTTQTCDVKEIACAAHRPPTVTRRPPAAEVNR